MKKSIAKSLGLYLALTTPVYAEEIPLDWLKREVTLSELHKEAYEFCVAIRKRTSKEGKCTLGAGNPFATQLPKDYRIFLFDSPSDNWQGLSGRRGYALVENGRVIDSIITAVN